MGHRTDTGRRASEKTASQYRSLQCSFGQLQPPENHCPSDAGSMILSRLTLVICVVGKETVVAVDHEQPYVALFTKSKHVGKALSAVSQFCAASTTLNCNLN